MTQLELVLGGNIKWQQDLECLGAKGIRGRDLRGDEALRFGRFLELEMGMFQLRTRQPVLAPCYDVNVS